MKRLSRALIALIMALLTASLLPAQVFADSTDEKYISEGPKGRTSISRRAATFRSNAPPTTFRIKTTTFRKSTAATGTNTTSGATAAS